MTNVHDLNRGRSLAEWPVTCDHVRFINDVALLLG